MAKLKLYCVYDNAAKAFGSPFPCATPGVAERHFKDMCRNPQYKFGQYAEDYSVFHVGEFCEDTAQIIPATPTLLVTARQVLDSGPVDHGPDLEVVRSAKPR